MGDSSDDESGVDYGVAVKNPFDFLSQFENLDGKEVAEKVQAESKSSKESRKGKKGNKEKTDHLDFGDDKSRNKRSMLLSPTENTKTDSKVSRQKLSSVSSASEGRRNVPAGGKRIGR